MATTRTHEIDPSPEAALREAATIAWTNLLRMRTAVGDKAVVDSTSSTNSDEICSTSSSALYHVHPDCATLILLGDKGSFVTGRPGNTEWPASLTTSDNGLFFVEAVKILPQGQQSAASVQFTVETDNGNDVYAGFMVFLHDTPKEKASQNETWIWNCISLAMAPKIACRKVLPETFQQVAALTWDGYCHANRQCDGDLMAQYFHSTCRLTYSTGGPDEESENPKIVICDSDAFYEKVTHRYTRETIHQHHRHLQQHPQAGDGDTLTSMEFATPDLCMVILDVGHPPFLWTDVLTCARIGRAKDNQNQKDAKSDEPSWWIMHKSSECEPHPLTLNESAVSTRKRNKRKTMGQHATMSAALCVFFLLQVTVYYNYGNAFSTSTSLQPFGPSQVRLRKHSTHVQSHQRSATISKQPLFAAEAARHENRFDDSNDYPYGKSGWWSFTFPSSFRTANMEFPSIELPDAILMIQETHEKYLETIQIVKKRRVFQRLVEIFSIMSGEILRPVLCSVIKSKPDLSKIHIPTDDDWDAFWSEKRGRKQLSNAERVARGIPALGPTFVKLALILATRPDILPIPLAEALGDLHYNVPPFDNLTAKRMIRTDLKTALRQQQQTNLTVSGNPYFQNKRDIDRFMETLSKRPVATGGIAQVYKGYIPGIGNVAVKVLRPGVRRKVERDTTLFHSIATWVESISNNTLNLPFVNVDIGSVRLVEAVDEFTSRVLEDMDFVREAENMKAFSNLYDSRKGTSPTVKVVVPEVLSDLSSNRIIVMEWIDGIRLTNICDDCDEKEQEEKENLELIVQAIEMTVSQLIDHGLLHGDPNLAHVLKVRNPQTGKPEIGYIDFGIVSYVPQTFRDAIVCAVTQLVFARNLEAVADLCGEMGLLPQEILTDPSERKRLMEALQTTMDDVLIWPKNTKGLSTAVPTIRFENLLPALSKFIQSFEFTMPPYFLNNVRALAQLEAMALKLDPNFNVLRVIYPYSINRLMRNPTVSKKVQNTFLEICRNPETKLISPRRVQMLLNDWALWTGYRKRKIFWDLVTSAGGRRVTPVIFQNWCANRVQNITVVLYHCRQFILRSWQRIGSILLGKTRRKCIRQSPAYISL
ncbi:ABC1 family-domain containing protein [Nitzschia inconspicua]|uniref:ABC1 family-domain containing protein n=1 Tax=Nitzschia inconspicua TaxID=303405 RepID=A0A9K3PL80_9STRA|nr:ABC1 family-domain containing protein [Nitzschia inconspicua]